MIRFYCEALGCTVEKRADHLGLVHLRAGGALIDLVSVEGPLGRKGGAAPGAEGRNLDHYCLRLRNFDFASLKEHFARFGIEPEAPAERFGADGIGPSIYIRDPEGNTIELKGGTGAIATWKP
jgi:catechol 2,3-dioxygenase-like lactoylglutathione lyase family enzyme